MDTKRREVVKYSAAALGSLALGNSALGRALSRPDKPLRILILGGTGFIGPHQVRYALSRGHSVTLFNRGRQKEEWPGDVEELLGDRNTGDLKSLRGRTWDVCIDNPTTLPFWVRDAGTTLRDHVKQYVFISTVSVYADNAKPDAYESAPLAVYNGNDAFAETMETLRANVEELYGPLKAASESEAERQFRGITTVIRPGLIVGPGDETDRFTYWPVRLARGGDILAPGDGSDAVQIIDARDLAEWTIRMVESRTFGVFNATGPAQPLTMGEMLATITDSLHMKPHITWVPATFLDEQHIQPWSDLPVWVPGRGSDAGFARRSIHNARRAGLTFRPLATTTVETLAWFHQQPEDRQAKLKAGLTPERERDALAAWNSQSHPANGSDRTGG
jgi:2'-hydroxyisoflavone reductase